MHLPFLTSLRSRLVFWNTFTLAVLLLALGAVIPLFVRSTMLSSIDREISERANHQLSRPPMPPDIRERDPNRKPPQDWDRDPNHAPPQEWQGGEHREPPRDWQNDGDGGRPPLPPPQRRLRFEPNGTNAGAPLRPLFFPKAGGDLQTSQIIPWDALGYEQALRGEEEFRTILREGEPVRVFSIPVLEQGRVIGAIQMPYPLTEVYRAVDGLRQTLLLLSPFALLIAGIGGYMMTGRALQAVQGITFAARRIGADALHQRLPVQGEDELGQLAGTFNAMLSRIEEGFNTKQNLIVQLNRLIEQQRRFTADAAHELRTPLTAIKINAEITLSHEATAAEYRLALQEINSTSTTLARLVDDLLLLARSDSGQLVRNLIDLPLQEPIQIAMAHVRRPDRAPITLQMGEEPIVVQACQDELTRLFTNLLENAARHTPADGKIVVTLKRAGGMAMVTVQDTGTGVAPEHLAHLGERFYRIDSARNREAGGSGLGLSICKSIVEAHRGTLTFASKLGEGTRVTVSLPLL